MYKLVVFIPEHEKEKVKNAMFEAGAGKIGNYDCCCFETSGRGQFRPLEGSDPAIGSQGRVEFVDEVKVEMVCDDKRISDVIEAMKNTHPYEEVAFDLYPLTNPESLK